MDTFCHLQYTAEILNCIQEIREEIRPPEGQVNGLCTEASGSGSLSPPTIDCQMRSPVHESAPNGDLSDRRRTERPLTPSIAQKGQKEGKVGGKSVEWKSQVSKQITLDQLDMEVKISKLC